MGPARPRGRHKGSESPARGSAAAASAEGRGGEHGATFGTRSEGAGGAAVAEGTESPLPQRSCGRSCTRGRGGSGREPCHRPPAIPVRVSVALAPVEERTFPIKPLPRDVREHRYLPAIKTNHSSASLGVCHREKSPRCERAPSVLPFLETQIYFFRQVSSSSRPALSGTCQGRKPLHSCRGGILIRGSPFADRAQPQASRKSMSSGDRQGAVAAGGRQTFLYRSDLDKTQEGGSTAGGAGPE